MGRFSIWFPLKPPKRGNPGTKKTYLFDFLGRKPKGMGSGFKFVQPLTWRLDSK